jgi:hypothetical protein
MSAEEKAVRDAAISKIAEMRKEVRKLVAAIDAVEMRVRSQPLSEKLQMGTPLRAVEGWIQSLMESHAVLAFCQDDLDAPRRYEGFAKQLSMTIDNWRDSFYNSTRKEVVVLPPRLPANTIKGHDDVRRVLAKRNGKPFEPRPRTVDPRTTPGWQGEPIRSR